MNDSRDEMKYLSMLSVEMENDDKDNVPSEISQSGIMNSYSINKTFTKEEIYKNLYYNAKYVPDKFEKM